VRLIALLLIAASAWAGGVQRIVSTAPSITETLFAMGLGPKVVGVTIYCKYPPEAAKLPKIGGLLNPDVEAIIGLKPDLVVVEKHPNRLAEELSRLHIPAVEVSSQNLTAVFISARTIGKAVGVPEAAEQFITRVRNQLQQLKTQTSGRSKQSVAFFVGTSGERLEGLIAGSGSSYFADLLEFAGGTNVFADVSAPYPHISLEEIVARDPDVILQLSGDTATKKESVRALWQQHQELKAVRSGRIYALESSSFLIPGPRAVDAVRLLIPILHADVHP
jgi:iron complex transport system substrate-binding protein